MSSSGDIATISCMLSPECPGTGNGRGVPGWDSEVSLGSWMDARHICSSCWLLTDSSAELRGDSGAGLQLAEVFGVISMETRGTELRLCANAARDLVRWLGSTYRQKARTKVCLNMERVANETVTPTKVFLLSNRKWWTVTDASCHAKSQLLLKHNETNKLTRKRDKRVRCSEN